MQLAWVLSEYSASGEAASQDVQDAYVGKDEGVEGVVPDLVQLSFQLVDVVLVEVDVDRAVHLPAESFLDPAQLFLRAVLDVLRIGPEGEVLQAEIDGIGTVCERGLNLLNASARGQQLHLLLWHRNLL